MKGKHIYHYMVQSIKFKKVFYMLSQCPIYHCAQGPVGQGDPYSCQTMCLRWIFAYVLQI
jgi:hypothetical protein